MGTCQTRSKIVQEFKFKETPIKNEKVEKILKSFNDPFQGITDQGIIGSYSKKWAENREKNIFYHGCWYKNTYHGRGMTYDKDNQELLIGTFFENEPMRVACRKIMKNGSVYFGELDEDFQKGGEGVFENQQFEYNGFFYDDKFNGRGRYIDKIQNKQYEGDFNNGEIERGTLKTDMGFYRGTFKNWLEDGQGQFVWKNGGKYKGQWKQGKKHGKGKQYNTEGKIVRAGQWANNEMK